MSQTSSQQPTLPADAKTRKNAPMYRGLLKYFPDALFAVADLSRIGNEQHNPGQPIHWDKTKSTDHADCIIRHLADAGAVDSDGVRHATKVAWRALALLQIELEEAAKTGSKSVEISEGWHPWTGGSMPKSLHGKKVEVRLRCGINHVDSADSFSWRHVHEGGDIVSYCVVR